MQWSEATRTVLRNTVSENTLKSKVSDHSVMVDSPVDNTTTVRKLQDMELTSVCNSFSHFCGENPGRGKWRTCVQSNVRWENEGNFIFEDTVQQNYKIFVLNWSSPVCRTALFSAVHSVPDGVGETFSAAVRFVPQPHLWPGAHGPFLLMTSVFRVRLTS